MLTDYLNALIYLYERHGIDKFNLYVMYLVTDDGEPILKTIRRTYPSLDRCSLSELKLLYRELVGQITSRDTSRHKLIQEIQKAFDLSFFQYVVLLLIRHPANVVTNDMVTKLCLIDPNIHHRLLEHNQDIHHEQEYKQAIVPKQDHKQAVIIDVPAQKIPCSICEEHESIIVLIPCGHASFCFTCTEKLKQTSNKCPNCRANITSTLRIFQ